MLYRLSLLWSERKVKTFIFKVVRQVGIIFAITIVCIVGAYCIGIPVLSILYNTDLHDYKTELLILLLGGGFLGLSGLLNAVITIIRCQEYLMWGYAIIAVLAFFMSNKIVSMYDVMGASVLYTLLMFGLCIIFSVMLIVGIKKNINEFNEV